MTDQSAKICGLIFCFNEEQIIGECLAFYLKQGIDCVVFDNESTDKSLSIIQSFQASHHFSGKIIDVISVKTNGYEWKKILKTASDYMHQYLSNYSWIMTIDADSFYVSPVKGMTLPEFLKAVGRYGYNIIDGNLCEFFPTEKDDISIANPLARIKYCDLNTFVICPQEKIFQYHPSITFYNRDGHVCYRQGSRPSIVKFIYKHYKWVSFDHGLRKVFKERKPRFCERKDDPKGHLQYLDVLPLKSDFIKESKKLTFYVEYLVQISKFQFILMMKFRKIIELVLYIRRLIMFAFVSVGDYWDGSHQVRDMIQSFRFAFSFDRGLAFYYLFLRFQEIVANIKEFFVRKLSISNSENFQSNVYFSVSLLEILSQRAYVFGLPRYYYFHVIQSESRVMSIDVFEKIFNNIPEVKKRVFVFCGRDLFQCEDFMKMTNYIRKYSPDTKIVIDQEDVALKEIYRKEGYPCFDPWDSIVINCDGQIVPCQKHYDDFYKKILDGVYDFGNLAQAHIVDIWNGDDHARLRRTCSYRYTDEIMTECIQK